MRYQILAFALSTISLSAGQEESAFINEQVDQLVRLHGDGIAASNSGQRKIIFGHFFSKNSNDAVVIFAIEGFSGGNGYAEYLATFRASETVGPWVKTIKPFYLVASTQIGGKLWREFNWDSIGVSPGVISVNGKQWKAKDPGCCPSTSFSTTFRIHHGSIVESH